jgi:5'-phosphate synthase pdxT subunit
LVSKVKIGVLALQGDVREHIVALNECGVAAFPAKTLEEIADIDGLVIPGGESTTISKLARSFGLFDAIKDRIKNGLPVYGSCAGLILLADKVEDAIVGQESFGGLDVVARRNAFGRQVDSFEVELSVKGITGPVFPAVFIRAPWIEKVGKDVEILAEVAGHAVAVRQKNILATSFHPELTGDIRLHKYFVEQIVTHNSKVAS